MSVIITNISMGRLLTSDEQTARDAYLETQMSAGLTNGATASVPGSFAGIRAWSTIDAANAFIAWANTNYNPAPLSAGVLTV